MKPYADKALEWFQNGWWPLPLPEGQKAPVPTGYTGYEGKEPDRAQIKKWIEANPSGNIAIRVPHNVIGIDVDVYGDKHGDQTLAELEANYGELPPTIRTSARGIASKSGIRWYRIREGATFPGSLGPGIEVVQYHHRYAVVYPSMNPSAKRRYQNIDDKTGEVFTECFAPENCTPLPEGWYEATAVRGEGLDKSARVNDAEVDAFLAEPGNAAQSCRAIKGVLKLERAKLSKAVDDGTSRYDTARDGCMALVRLAQEGHRGVSAALSELESDYLDSVAGETGRDPGEWPRMLQGAVAAVIDSMEEAHERGRCPDRATEPTEPGKEPWPPPSKPYRVAERLLDEFWTVDGHRTLAHWRGDFYEWTGTHYALRELPAMEAILYARLDKVTYSGANGETPEWTPNKTRIANVVASLAAQVRRESEREHDAVHDDYTLISFTNGTLRLDKASGTKTLRPNAPTDFLLSSLPFDYDPEVGDPETWLDFLDSLEVDTDVIDLLQEWFGYVISGDTSMHKFLYLYGATRAGKSTITRVLRRLVGPSNATSPDVNPSVSTSDSCRSSARHLSP